MVKLLAWGDFTDQQKEEVFDKIAELSHHVEKKLDLKNDQKASELAVHLQSKEMRKMEKQLYEAVYDIIGTEDLNHANEVVKEAIDEYHRSRNTPLLNELDHVEPAKVKNISIADHGFEDDHPTLILHDPDSKPVSAWKKYPTPSDNGKVDDDIWKDLIKSRQTKESLMKSDLWDVLNPQQQNALVAKRIEFEAGIKTPEYIYVSSSKNSDDEKDVKELRKMILTVLQPHLEEAHMEYKKEEGSKIDPKQFTTMAINHIYNKVEELALGKGLQR